MVDTATATDTDRIERLGLSRRSMRLTQPRWDRGDGGDGHGSTRRRADRVSWYFIHEASEFHEPTLTRQASRSSRAFSERLATRADENSDATGASRAVFTAIANDGTARTRNRSRPTRDEQSFDAENEKWRPAGRGYPPRLLISKTGVSGLVVRRNRRPVRPCGCRAFIQPVIFRVRIPGLLGVVHVRILVARLLGFDEFG